MNTTAARRIVRHANAQVADLHTYYDIDGNPLETVTTEGYATVPDAALRLAGGIGNIDGRYTIANILERMKNHAILAEPFDADEFYATI